MGCKTCIHYDVCSDWRKSEYGDELPDRPCNFYKSNTSVIETPCVAMVEQFIKDGEFDKKHIAYNGRIAVVYIDKSKWNSPLIDITEQFYNTDKAVERIQALKERENNA